MILAQRKKISNQLNNCMKNHQREKFPPLPLPVLQKSQIALLPPEFQPLPVWLPAQAFPCTVTSSSPQIHKMATFIKSIFLAGLISQTLKPKRSDFQTQ
jgi:hypothetical protein